jgi:hypothetical protein
MSAEWAAVIISVITAVAAAVAVAVLREGRREGKLDAGIAQLTEIVRDHEDRIRALERRLPYAGRCHAGAYVLLTYAVADEMRSRSRFPAPPGARK